MVKIKLTKGELKRQRDSLAQFRRYLPTLQLKKQQLQMKISEVKKIYGERQKLFHEKYEQAKSWAGLLKEAPVEFEKWVWPVSVKIITVNIAGASVCLFEKAEFEEAQYDFYWTPLWVDLAIVQMREITSLLSENILLKEQIAILEHELRVTTQRVNLFEKIMIPQCLDHIRKIRIYLGDQQANAVGIGKVAKKKIEARLLEEMLV